MRFLSRNISKTIDSRSELFCVGVVVVATTVAYSTKTRQKSSTIACDDSREDENEGMDKTNFLKCDRLGLLEYWKLERKVGQAVVTEVDAISKERRKRSVCVSSAVAKISRASCRSNRLQLFSISCFAAKALKKPFLMMVGLFSSDCIRISVTYWSIKGECRREGRRFKAALVCSNECRRASIVARCRFSSSSSQRTWANIASYLSWLSCLCLYTSRPASISSQNTSSSLGIGSRV
ncbi:hypothetical protein BDR26DRAFT_863806 [Obelidium mucronatum]|nr:hypothetical protein BDR26DRAFT_863806 [Obelidium mucronatum]